LSKGNRQKIGLVLAQLRTGLSATSAVVLVGFAAVMLGAAAKAFGRQDVH